MKNGGLIKMKIQLGKTRILHKPSDGILKQVAQQRGYVIILEHFQSSSRLLR